MATFSSLPSDVTSYAQIWYLVLSNVHVSVSKPSLSKSRLLFKGDLVVTCCQDSGKLYVKVQAMNYPGEVMKCPRKDLLELSDEEVMWLRPCILTSKRYSLVMTDPAKVWNKRNMLVKGAKLNFCIGVSKAMITGTFQKKRLKEESAGYMIDVKIDEVNNI